MSTFVIVAGGWGGGWEWADVGRLLTRAGHDVLRVTRTGLGDRAHLHPNEPIGLATHIDDVVATLEAEDVHGAILCGASLGGMAATGAAHRAGGRVALLVYVDALTPRPGESALDLLPGAFGDLVREGLAHHGPAWRVPPPRALLDALVPTGSLPEARRAAYLSRLRDEPAAALADPLPAPPGPGPSDRAFIRCTASTLAGYADEDPIARCAARARTEGWTYAEIAAPHDPQVFAPRATADALVDLAG
jgi:pimeloyl-ACP methyl ester carboxylesterase